MGVIDEAQKWIGKVKYVFGGDNVEGGIADCSSFVQYVFRKNGMEVGRTTFDQIQKGVEVPKEQLQAGDLVFFQGTYNTSGPSHVGIYIGNNQFIDCGSSGVRVSSLDSSYWQEHWLSARRIEGTPVGGGMVSGGVIHTGSGGGELPWYKDVAVFLIVILAVIMGILFLAWAFGFSLNPLG